LNIDPDLQWFDVIVPCGLHGLGVTSIALETGTAPDTTAITTTVLEAIAHEFNTELRSETSSQEARHDH
jgi:lipoate-protein ligase B